MKSVPNGGGKEKPKDDDSLLFPAMSPEEIRASWEEFQTFDPYEYYDDNGKVDLERLKADGKGKMIRSITFDKDRKVVSVKLQNETAGHIYLIAATSIGLYKIGFATNFKKRFESLSCASPVELHKIMVVRVRNARAVEKMLHTMFSEKRKHGEWFSLLDGDIDIVADILEQNKMNTTGA